MNALLAASPDPALTQILSGDQSSAEQLQQLRKRMMLMQFLQQQKTQQPPMTLGLNPQQYPSLQAGAGATGGQQMNPNMLLYAAMLQQQQGNNALMAQ